MVGQRYGWIVNLSSSSALGNRGQANYSAAKAGLQGLTKTLAIELGPFGITANAVAPGFIATDMTAATAARLGMTFEDFQAAAASQVPARRIGEVDDVAHAISFLASEGARYISGRRPVSSCISGPTSRWYYLLIEKSRNFVQYILVVDLVR
jgi:3-oxoacyl-[acyl-carrier protein] reductase